MEKAPEPMWSPLGGLNQDIRSGPDPEHFDAVNIAVLQHLSVDSASHSGLLQNRLGCLHLPSGKG